MRLAVSFPEYATARDMRLFYAAAHARLFKPVEIVPAVPAPVGIGSGEGPGPSTLAADLSSSPSESFRGGPEPILTVGRIQKTVCEVFGISMELIKSGSRRRDVCLPRQIAMAVSRKLRGHLTLPEIGRRFGGRDHSTVLHAIAKMAPVIAAVPMCQVLRDYIIALRDEAIRNPPPVPRRSAKVEYWAIVKGRSHELGRVSDR